jgi:uncharacterized protein (DUF3084 family)
MSPFMIVRLVIVAGLLAAGGLVGYKIGSNFYRVQLETAKAEFAEAKAKATAASLKQAEEFREREAKMQTAVDEARRMFENVSAENSDLNRQIVEANSRIARLDSNARGLRQRIDSFAAGRGAKDSLASCQAERGRLGALLADSTELLIEGHDLVIESAEMVRAASFAADERRAKFLACYKGYPQ